jgi:hypothetical protein
MGMRKYVRTGIRWWICDGCVLVGVVAVVS